ncbi:MAG: hypothetical protein V1920_03310, partial [Bacillota bacterium]
MLKRYLIHITGFIIISFGLICVIFSKLGATPVDAFNYFVYTLTPLSLGTIVIITGLFVALLAFVLHPTKDMIISILFLFMVGLLIDGWKFLFEMLPSSFFDNLMIRISLASIGLVLIAFGVAITITTGLASSPYEKLMMELNKKIHSIQYSKMIIEGTFFTLAVIMGIYTDQLFD